MAQPETHWLADHGWWGALAMPVLFLGAWLARWWSRTNRLENHLVQLQENHVELRGDVKALRSHLDREFSDLRAQMNRHLQDSLNHARQRS